MIGSKGIPEHDKRWLGRAVIVFGILAALTSMHATAQTAVVSDSTFLNADWTLSQFFRVRPALTHCRRTAAR